ncbi:SsgA family sporulation/cell division regulator [Nonomuraea sp. NPDC049714]|uniref:SsgA family sporulation/cell division regulator n=1 Tax=Nonomuraea sp. NPDC049714 TaxID=3364357 RepID=UPI0037AD97E9
MKSLPIVQGLLMWSIDRQPINAMLRYDIGDPFAVTLAFVDNAGRQTVSYLFGRALLIDGLEGPAGEDLILIGPHEADGFTVVTLTPEHGALPMEFHVATSVLRKFVEATCRWVPLGREIDHLDLDQAVAYLLGATS